MDEEKIGLSHALAASRAAAPVGADPPSAAALLRQASSEASRASTAAEGSGVTQCRASCWGDEGVGGAAFGGAGRVFRPAPRLTDESMISDLFRPRRRV